MAKKASIPTTTPARPINPCFAFSGSKLLINFTVTASKSKETPICKSPVFKPLRLAPCLLISTDAADILSIAIANPTSTPASTAIAPTAFQSFTGSSIFVRTYIAATNIAIDSAILRSAFAFKSHAKASSALLKLASTLPAYSTMSSKCPITPAIPAKAVAIFFRANVIATTIPPANILPHSMFPLSSVIKSQKLLNALIMNSPIFFIAPITGSFMSFMAFIAPLKKSQIIEYAFHDGE